ncbi:MAG: winged helix-turn-helix transcriptional regulator [Candidatus Heimdallarchaeota archaeon]|nr:winged helix-turn-helix transcriptional regulator [Candidatus Heimdallarchaeota archaeon]MCK4255182.1 winged helix-turn-helix transcriptional regulator [Candidatus Heimdallarchaeota archaeon]
MKDERRKRVPKKISSVSHPTRKAIVDELKEKNQTTLDLEQSLNESRYNLYHHLEVLENQGIIEQQRDGKVKVYRLRKGATPIILEVETLPKDKHEIFKQLLNKILILWKEKEIKNITDIDEVLIVPTKKEKK